MVRRALDQIVEQCTSVRNQRLESNMTRPERTVKANGVLRRRLEVAEWLKAVC